MNKSASRVSVVGLGASGDAAARLALAKGAQVHVTDSNTDDPIAARGARLRDLGAEVRLGGDSVEEIRASDTVVVSPGIPPDAPLLRGLRARGIGWISEPEFAFRFFRSPLIAITGTNGKTTTAALLAHLLDAAGVSVGLGGNIGQDFGPPASTLALLDPPPDWLVLELSSFQLADVDQLRADIGVLTNLGTDHLDRYPDVASYHADKRRLFNRAGEDSRWVLNADDPRVVKMSEGVPGQRFYFSLEEPQSPGAFISGDTMMVDFGTGPLPVAKIETLQMVGRHNRANALAAVLAACATGTSLDLIRPGLESFRPLPHRLEPVGRVGRVVWINDSKATNVHATLNALASLDGPIVLLLGGTDKGEDFTQLSGELGPKVRAVVAYGAAGPRIDDELSTAATVTLVTGGFEDAVDRAAGLARSGDTLLLSPACSSYDMFDNYQVRGDRFRALAQEAA